MSSLTINWVDFVVVLLLGVGLWRGRKRGMSQELLDVIKWTLVVLIPGFLSWPVGTLLGQFFPSLSALFCYVAIYMSLALSILFIFALIRRGSAEKLAGSDLFGASEYYLGMMAGSFRYACIILFAMALLNARQYSAAEIKAKIKYQDDNFGTTFFLTLPDIQRAVFKESLIGRLTQEYLQVVLIHPAAPGEKVASDSSTARARERSGPR